MGDKTGIEWTDQTWNPIVAYNMETGLRGHWCVPISGGCANCYASMFNEHPRWMGTGVAYKAQNRNRVQIQLHPPTLEKMLRSRKAERVFVCSMTDLFLADHSDDWLVTIFATMALSPEKTFQVLTKRIERAAVFLSDPAIQERIWQEMSRLINAYHLKGRSVPAIWPLPNVWMGATTEDQEALDTRKPVLMTIAAIVRFLSVEPLLGPINLKLSEGRVDWVILGGESGPGARPMHPDWALDVRDQCAEAEVPLLFKQWGAWEYMMEADAWALEIGGMDSAGVGSYSSGVCVLEPSGKVHRPTSPLRTFWAKGGWEDDPDSGSEAVVMHNVGKKVAGRLLDGVLYDGYPEVAA